MPPAGHAGTALSASALRQGAPYLQALGGFSQSAGGEVQITVPATGDFAATTELATRTRDVVVPGSAGAPSSLVCVNRCPKGGLQASDFTKSPFKDISISGMPAAVSSESAFGPVTTGNAISYTFSGSGAQAGLLLDAQGNAVDASGFSLNGMYANGLVSGRLIDPNDSRLDPASNKTVYQSVRCQQGAPSPGGSPYNQADAGNTICPWLVEKAYVYYTYETGPNPWNRYISLSASGSTVTFDPPKMFTLPVSTTTTTIRSGDAMENTNLRLQFNGFGDLQGLPGQCVDMRSNKAVQCGSATGSDLQFVRWVPALSIKDGTEITADDNAKFYVKYLERELRFGLASATSCSTMTLPLSATLPGAPTLNAGTLAGSKPTVTDPPAVVHGVLQK